ncbi:hypothetical protein [Ensifer sp. BR816]|uniref:hypothetical protein n=1 Tax=Rhizobium sp. (strain BR816) TaxID=1057002 RepID=UPI0012FBBE0C|nr:hypothetical protein [Ensifer sp. BR816]
MDMGGLVVSRGAGQATFGPHIPELQPRQKLVESSARTRKAGFQRSRRPIARIAHLSLLDLQRRQMCFGGSSERKLDLGGISDG